MRRAAGERRGRPVRDPSRRLIPEFEALSRRIFSALSTLRTLGDLDPRARERLELVAVELVRVGGELRRVTAGSPTIAGAGRPTPFEAREQAAVGAE
jgi:hypothetical protein